MNLPQVARWLIFLLVFGLTAGCHHPRRAAIEPAELPYKIVGASDPAVMAIKERLEKNGVRVLTVGQEYMVSFPTLGLFPDGSPRLLWGSYALLNDVVCYLKQFRKVSVTVVAFSSKCLSDKRERALTLARARAVGNYLWSQGIDSRFIFTQGLGSDKPIVGQVINNDKSANSRIEIIFREAV